MPFDSLPAEVRPAALEVDLINRTIALLSTHRRWCKGKSVAGHHRFCLIGALTRADEEMCPGGSQVLNMVFGHLGVLAGRDPVVFNDHPATRHRDVISLLTRTRAWFE